MVNAKNYKLEALHSSSVKARDYFEYVYVIQVGFK